MGPNDSLVGRMFLCWLLCKLHPMLSKACAEFCDCQSSGICEELHEVSTSTGPVNTLQPLFFQGSMGECPGSIERRQDLPSTEGSTDPKRKRHNYCHTESTHLYQRGGSVFTFLLCALNSEAGFGMN